MIRRLLSYTWRIAAALVVVIFVTLFACSFDDDLLDTSALRYEPRQIPDTENAYLVLTESAERLGNIDADELHRWSALLTGPDRDETEADECLRDREHAIDAVRRLRSFRSAQAPIPQDADSAYRLLPRFDLPVRLALLEARHLQHAQDHAAAIKLVQDCIHAARIMNEGRSGSLYFYYALGMQLATLDAVVSLVSDPVTPLTDCHDLYRDIAQSRPDKEGFEQLIAAEYRAQELVIEALDNPAKMPASCHPEDKRYLPYRLPFLFKPNQTLNYSIPYLLTMRGAVDLSLADRERTIPHNADLLGFLCDQYDDWINRLGKQHAHDGGVSSVSSLLERRLTQQTQISLTETLIAIRLHYDAHDRELPTALADLVPEYLPNVPRDYFDGKTIKYSRDLRAIWSAGPKGKFELTDVGQDVHHRELILPLCFDGSYTPWPRRDPTRRQFHYEEGESHGFTENQPPES